MRVRNWFLTALCACGSLGAYASEWDFGQLIDKTAKGEVVLKGGMVTMVDPDVAYIRKYLLALRAAGANHIRMNTYPTEGMNADEIAATALPEGWDDFASGRMFELQPWVEGNRAQLERWLPLCEEIGLGVIVSLDAGFYPMISDNKAPLWTDAELRKKLVRYIVEKARYYSNSKAVIGYDLINEPIPPGSEPWILDGEWFTWGYDAAKADQEVPGGSKILAEFYNEVIAGIRQFDTERLIVLEPGPWGYPAALPGLLDVVDDERVIFSFHFYDPHGFTHNNVGTWGGRSTEAQPYGSYPFPFGESKQSYDKHLLAKATQSVVDFQRERSARTGRPTVIWIGEFGSVRWNDAESLKRWTQDALDLMAKNDWGWAYFLYSPTHADWHHFSPFGPEGENLDRQAYWQARKENNIEFFKKLNAQGPRPSFQLLLDDMAKTRERNDTPRKAETAQ